MAVGLTNSGDYSAFAFLNRRNRQYVGTVWRWEHFITPAGPDDIDEADSLAILISKDGSITVTSADCGQVIGTCASSGMENISFDIDASSLTCAADSPGEKFVQYLNDTTPWSFNNSRLLIELPADSGTMVLN